MSQDSDIQKIIRNAQSQGFRYSKTTQGHHQLYSPDGNHIVTHSGTSSDHRGFYNFLSQLKRAGYMELQTLGDAMPSVKPENGGAKLSASQYVIDLLSRHEEGVSNQDIAAYIRSVRPDLGVSSPSNATHFLIQKGVVKRMPSGIYMLVDRTIDHTIRKAPKPRLQKLVQLAPSELGSAPAGFKTGDATIDKDLKALDEALSALAKIETVVRKNREVLVQFAKLKAMLK